jgi:hypothetical protein
VRGSVPSRRLHPTTLAASFRLTTPGNGGPAGSTGSRPDVARVRPSFLSLFAGGRVVWILIRRVAHASTFLYRQPPSRFRRALLGSHHCKRVSGTVRATLWTRTRFMSVSSQKRKSVARRFQFRVVRCERAAESVRCLSFGDRRRSRSTTQYVGVVARRCPSDQTMSSGS